MRFTTRHKSSVQNYSFIPENLPVSEESTPQAHQHHMLAVSYHQEPLVLVQRQHAGDFGMHLGQHHHTASKKNTTDSKQLHMHKLIFNGLHLVPDNRNTKLL